LRAGLFTIPAFAFKVLGAQIARLRASASFFEKNFAVVTIPRALDKDRMFKNKILNVRPFFMPRD
jgi:hypothetical protein